MRDGIPRIELYSDGRATPSPAVIDFTPGELVGDATGALGLRKFLAARGHSMTILLDQDELASRFDQELPEAEIVISQAYWPARLTAEGTCHCAQAPAGDHRGRGRRCGPCGVRRVLRRLRPFDVRLHYTDPKRLPLPVCNDLRSMHHPTCVAMVPICDVVSIHAPLRVATVGLFDGDMIGRMKQRSLSHQYGTWRNLRPRSHRACLGDWPTRRLCDGHAVTARCIRAHRGIDLVRAGPLCRRCP